MSNKEKTITLNDLKDGDVLVMQGPQGWGDMSLHLALQKAIMWLTDSDVTHGALYLGLIDGTQYLVDDGTNGVARHTMSHEGGEPALWYVRRPTIDAPLSPVLEVAKKYEGESTAYDWELLAMVGFLLLFKKMEDNDLYYGLFLELLKKMVVYIDKHTHKDDTRYFICSQFVATCFEEAGAQYGLDVVDGNLQVKSMAQGVTLIDYCLTNSKLISDKLGQVDAETISEPTGDDIKALIEAYDNKTSLLSMDEHNQLFRELVNVTDDFLSVFFKINAKALKLNPEDWDTPEKRFTLAKQYQAEFITPADLKSHCQNLKDIGTVTFVYG